MIPPTCCRCFSRAAIFNMPSDHPHDVGATSGGEPPKPPEPITSRGEGRACMTPPPPGTLGQPARRGDRLTPAVAPAEPPTQDSSPSGGRHGEEAGDDLTQQMSSNGIDARHRWDRPDLGPWPHPGGFRGAWTSDACKATGSGGCARRSPARGWARSSSSAPAASPGP